MLWIELLKAECIDFELTAVAFGLVRLLRWIGTRGLEIDQFPLIVSSPEEPVYDSVDDAVAEFQRKRQFGSGCGIGEQTEAEGRGAETFQQIQQILSAGLCPLAIGQGMGQEEAVDAGGGILAWIEGEFFQERVSEFAEEERAVTGLILGGWIPEGQTQNIAAVVVFGRLLEEDDFGNGKGRLEVVVDEGVEGAESDGPFCGFPC